MFKLRILLSVLAMLWASLLLPQTASAFDLEGRHRGVSYGAFHAHHNACGGVYTNAYRYDRPHYYRANVKPGRYVWRKRRVMLQPPRLVTPRAGLRRYRVRKPAVFGWVSQRVLVRPVRYRITKHHAGGRYVARPIVVKGTPRGRHRRRARC